MGHGPPFRQERHHRLGPSFDQLRHIFGLLSREMRQHILFRGEPGPGPPDAQLDPEKLLGVQGGDDVQNSPMTPRTAPLHDLEAPERHIQVVMDNHQIFGAELEVSHETGYRLAAQIHIGGGLRQDDALPFHPSLAPDGLQAFLAQGNPPLLREQGHHLPAQIVPSPGVLPAWISQSHD